jgi:hypothetical protein
MRFVVPLLALAALCSACISPTPYQPLTGAYGVGISAEDGDMVTILSKGNAATTRLTVTDYAMRKAAEVATERGKLYFVVLGYADITRIESDYVPGQSREVTTKSGHKYTTYDAAYYVETAFPGIRARVVLLDEPKFDFLPGLETLDIFKASDVLASASAQDAAKTQGDAS